MATVATYGGNWIVNGCFQEFQLGRGMGIMTGRAFFDFDRIIAVGLFECATLGVMAVEAELRLGLAQ